MIKRDEFGLVVQHDPKNLAYKDGGDSCARAGILALASFTDAKNLELYATSDAKLVRHPFQENFKCPKKTSRDNLVQFCVGVTEENVKAKRVAAHYANKFFINKDFLDPAVRLYLYTVAGETPPLWIRWVGSVYLRLALWFNSYVTPKAEINQFACIAIRMGMVKDLYRLHPDLESNIRQYWSGWRDNAEIGEILIQKLRSLTSMQNS